MLIFSLYNEYIAIFLSGKTNGNKKLQQKNRKNKHFLSFCLFLYHGIKKCIFFSSAIFLIFEYILIRNLPFHLDKYWPSLKDFIFDCIHFKFFRYRNAIILFKNYSLITKHDGILNLSENLIKITLWRQHSIK